MAKSNIASILNGVRDFKKVMEEVQDMSPQIKSALSLLISEAKSGNSSEQRKQDIYDAIQFAVKKIRNDPAVILGCDWDDPEELKKKIYHLKSQYFHTDGKSPSPDKFKKIKEAYDRIKNS